MRGGFVTRKEAEAALAGWLVERQQGRHVDRSRITVAEFLVDQWLDAMAMGIAGSTLEGYRGLVHRYVVPRIGGVVLQELTPPTLNWLYADVRKNGRARSAEPLSLKTVREVHVVLHRALEDAVRWDYLASNPADRANAPSATAAKNQRKKAIRTWTAAEVERFARVNVGHALYPLWLLAASTGMRRSELLALRWEDVDLERGLLAVRQVLVKVGGKAEFKDAPKSQHGYRTLRLAPRVIRVLHEVLGRQQELARSWDGSPFKLVFCRDDGKPWHPDHVTETIRELISESGLPAIRPLQDLRHTHATLLLADGENAKVVQERLGHHSHSFTADTYQHVMPGMDTAAASRFDGLVFGPDDDGVSTPTSEG